MAYLLWFLIKFRWREKSEVVTKVIFLILVFVNSFVFSVDAKTYTNTGAGYSVEFPDFFVERKNFGMYDFRADGGDNYGVGNLKEGKDGIEISTSSSSSDKDSLSDDDLERQISAYDATAKSFGIFTQYRIVPVYPNHKGIFSMSFTRKNNTTMIICSIEAVMHGKKNIVSISGTEHNKPMIASILESFRCVVKH